MIDGVRTGTRMLSGRSTSQEAWPEDNSMKTVGIKMEPDTTQHGPNNQFQFRKKGDHPCNKA